VCVILISLLLGLGHSAVGDDWLSWRGPQNTGESFESGLPASSGDILWRAPYGGRSTPVIKDGRVFMINKAETGVMEQERVMSLDLQTGSPIWEHRFNVFHTDIPSARVGWASPVIDGETGNVYAHGIQGMFFCFSRDGKILWSRSMTETLGRISGYGGRTHTPIIDEDQVIISFLNSSFGPQGRGQHRYLAMNKHTGEVHWWSAPAGPPLDTTYAVPVVTEVNGQRLLIAGAADGGIYAMNVRTGNKVWGFQLSKRGINSSIVVDGYKVYATHSEENHDTLAMGRVVCIDARGEGDVTATHEIWRQDGITAGYSSLLLHGKKLYVMNNFGVLYSFDAGTGAERWQHTVGRVGKGSPIWADGRLYVPMVNGSLAILEDAGDKVNELDRITFESDHGGVVELFGGVAVSDGYVVFCTTEETICLAVRGGERQRAKIAQLASIQVRPGEILTRPGETTQFSVVGFDKVGQPLGEIKADWSYAGKGASIASTGSFQAEAKVGSIGTVTAKAGELSATARVRIVPELPFFEDFESYEDGGMISWWIGASKAKHAIETLDGSKVLKKLADNRGPKFNRSRVYMTPPLETGYTVQADLMGTKKGRRRGDVGLINARYRMEMFGNVNKLRVMSWVPGPRFEKSMEFTWDPDRWYSAKFTVELEDGKALLRVKVWPRDEAEPEAWTLEAEDPQPNLEGAAGIYAYSMTPLYYDHVRVYR
jgi:outer membrane protein assembly factor BamB